jgi:hypothetical protein
MAESELSDGQRTYGNSTKACPVCGEPIQATAKKYPLRVIFRLRICRVVERERNQRHT